MPALAQRWWLSLPMQALMPELLPAQGLVLVRQQALERVFAVSAMAQGSLLQAKLMHQAQLLLLSLGLWRPAL